MTLPTAKNVWPPGGSHWGSIKCLTRAAPSTRGAQKQIPISGISFFAMRTHSNWFIAGVAALCLVTGVALSHLIEPGVRVQKVTLAEETPALKFLPAGPGPHPVALLAHGYAGSKETLFRYGEALAAAGFICYDVDQPGHGASRRTFTFMEAVHTLEAVAREIGPVDVFAGQSMGGFTGGEAVREGGMRPGLFIAIGSMPVLGDHAPPLLLLTGRFEQAFPPALLKTRTDARLVISPWSDHMLEGFDPVLVNAGVEAACATVHKTPPPPPTAWRWRLIGAVLAMSAAGILASYLTQLLPQLAQFRGLFIGVFIVVAFILTVRGRWIDATPHLGLQGIAMPVTLLLAIIAGRLRDPAMELRRAGCPCDGDCGMVVQSEPESSRAYSHGFCSGPYACLDRRNCHRLGCGPPRAPAARRHRHGHLRGLRPLPMPGAATNGS